MNISINLDNTKQFMVQKLVEYCLMDIFMYKMKKNKRIFRKGLHMFVARGNLSLSNPNSTDNDRPDKLNRHDCLCSDTGNTRQLPHVPQYPQ